MLFSHTEKKTPSASSTAGPRRKTWSSMRTSSGPAGVRTRRGDCAIPRATAATATISGGAVTAITFSAGSGAANTVNDIVHILENARDINGPADFFGAIGDVTTFGGVYTYAVGRGAGGLAPAGPAETGPVFDPAAEEPALRKAMDDEESAWNRADAKAFSAAFRDDATFADAFGSVARGRAEVDKRIADVLATWHGTRVALKVRRIRVLKPDVALVEADAELTGWKKLPPGFRAEDDQIVRSRLLQVFQKEAGLWRVAASYEVDVKTKLELPPVPEERTIRGRGH